MIKGFSDKLGMSPGVYHIIHIPSNRVYVGSAVKLNNRYRAHVWEFANKKNSKYLQRAYEKNKSTDFVMEILELVCKKSRLIKVEQKWIDRYFDNQNKCFNIAPIAGSCLGVKSSIEKRKKLSKIRLRQWKSDKEYKEKMMQIALARRKRYSFISPENIVFSGLGVGSFCRENRLHAGHMTSLLNGKLKSYNGWRIPENLEYVFDRKVFCRMIGKNRASTYNIKVMSPSGTVYGPITNLKNFCREHGLHRVSMRKLFKNEILQTKGWKITNG